MALSPLQPRKETVVAPQIQTSKTYKLDFDSGKLGGIINGKEAVRQFIHKTVTTARFRFPIYTDEYGCELENLIGLDIPIELLNSEIPRVIREALIYDERIKEVNNFDIRRDYDKLYVSFSVTTVEGVINEEVAV